MLCLPNSSLGYPAGIGHSDDRRKVSCIESGLITGLCIARFIQSVLDVQVTENGLIRSRLRGRDVWFTNRTITACPFAKGLKHSSMVEFYIHSADWRRYCRRRRIEGRRMQNEVGNVHSVKHEDLCCHGAVLF